MKKKLITSLTNQMVIFALLCLFIINRTIVFYLRLDNTNIIYLLLAFLITILITIGTLYIINRYKYLSIIGVGLYSFFLAMMIVEIIYFRYYNRAFSVQTLLMARDLPKIAQSSTGLYRATDIFLFAEIVFFLLYLGIVYYKKYKGIDTRLEPVAYIRNIEINYKKAITKFLVSFIIITGLTGFLTGETFFTFLANKEYFGSRIQDVYVTFVRAMDLNTDEDEYSIDDYMRHFGGNEPTKAEVSYNSVAKDKHVFVIMLESFQNFNIGLEYNNQEISPYINKLIEKDSFYFNNAYQLIGLGNTSDAEFVMNNSIVPIGYAGVQEVLFENNYYGLPMMLKDKGYTTSYFHGNDIEFWSRDKGLPSQGFDNLYGKDSFDIKEETIWGLTDIPFMEQSLDIIKESVESGEKMYAYLTTLTNHRPFTTPDTIDLIDPIEQEEEYIANYLNTVRYTDSAVEVFIDGLKEMGIYEDSVIVIFGDHFGITSWIQEDVIERMNEILGYNYEISEALNIPVIIHIPGIGESTVKDIPMSQLDIMPTMMNLLGIDKHETYYMGLDVLNVNKGYTNTMVYTNIGSFVIDDIFFENSTSGLINDSVITNIKTHEKEFINAKDIPYYNNYITRSKERLLYGSSILENNLLLRLKYEVNKLKTLEE